MASQLIRCGVAGSDPATPFFRLGLIGALVAALVSASATAHAQLDPETREEMRKRGEMQNVRKSTLLAERNLARGVEDRDSSRIVLVVEYLSSTAIKRAYEENKLEETCYSAAHWLGVAATAAGMLINTKAMTVDIDEDKSISLRPPDETIMKWYEEGYSNFAIKIASCEETMNFRKSQRVLPEKPPQVK